MVASIDFFDKNGAQIKNIEIQGLSDVAFIEDDNFYITRFYLNNRIVRQLSRIIDTNCRVDLTTESFSLDGLSIRTIFLRDRFTSNRSTSICLAKKHRMSGREIRYLVKILKNYGNIRIRPFRVETSTGESGDCHAFIDWICQSHGCIDLAVCEEGYCDVHCIECPNYQTCSLSEIIRIIPRDTGFFNAIDSLRHISEVESGLPQDRYRLLISYRIYNEFIKSFNIENRTASTISRFAYVIQLVNEFCELFYSNLSKDVIFQAELEEVILDTLLDLCQWGTIEFIQQAKKYHLLKVSTTHFFDGFCWETCREFRSRQQTFNFLLCKSYDRARLNRRYYSGLFIPFSVDPEFWNWFQRLESKLGKETDRNQSREIGLKLYENFGHQLKDVLGDHVKITDYGGGTGETLASFLRHFLQQPQVPKDVQIRLIDVNANSLYKAHQNISSVLSEYGYSESALETVNANLFNVVLESSDIAIISQVLDLYTIPDLQRSRKSTNNLESGLLNFIVALVRDKRTIADNQKKSWEYTLETAKQLMSSYSYLSARIIGLTDEPYNSKNAYFLRSKIMNNALEWLKRVAKRSDYLFIADRVVDRSLLSKVGLRAEEGNESGPINLSLIKR